MACGFNNETTEHLTRVWESNECTKDEWKFLCALFGEDSEHTLVLKLVDFTKEVLTSEQKINNHCSSEDSIFTD